MPTLYMSLRLLGLAFVGPDGRAGAEQRAVGGAGQVAYSTAKAGLVGLTRTVAIECARRGLSWMQNASTW